MQKADRDTLFCVANFLSALDVMQFMLAMGKKFVRFTQEFIPYDPSKLREMERTLPNGFHLSVFRTVVHYPKVVQRARETAHFLQALLSSSQKCFVPANGILDFDIACVVSRELGRRHRVDWSELLHQGVAIKNSLCYICGLDGVDTSLLPTGDPLFGPAIDLLFEHFSKEVYWRHLAVQYFNEKKLAGLHASTVRKQEHTLANSRRDTMKYKRAEKNIERYRDLAQRRRSDTNKRLQELMSVVPPGWKDKYRI
jgi:hypothetical protein